MKKTFTTIGLVMIAFISTTAFIKNSTGIAGQTGSAGETSCNSCHGGGTASSSAITITSTPSFTNNEYVPGTTYNMTITATAAGFSSYGFGCEILNGANANAGTMQAPGAGVQFLNSGARRNAVHTMPKTGNATAAFTFQWVAPAINSGGISIFVAANAVNNSGSVNGDFPITPISLTLNEAEPPVIDGIRENNVSQVSQVNIYPSPSNGITNMSYVLQSSGTVVAELIDISGKTVKQLFSNEQAPGLQSHIINLTQVPSGVYFVRTSVNGQQASQKLITIQ